MHDTIRRGQPEGGSSGQEDRVRLRDQMRGIECLDLARTAGMPANVTCGAKRPEHDRAARAAGRVRGMADSKARNRCERVILHGGKLAIRLLARTPESTLSRVLDLFLSSLPSFHTLLVVAPIALLYGLFIAWVVGWLRCVRHVRTAYTRKIFHFTIFTMATIVHLRWGLPGVTVLGSVTSSIVLYGVWRGSGYPFYEALARPADAPHRTLFIIVPLLTTILGGILSNTFFPVYAYVGYLVCGWGDAVGEPVGSRWGRHKYRVPSLSGVPATRSIEGSFAVFVTGSVAAIAGFYAYGHPPRYAVMVGIACGLAGAVVEAISTHGLDNLTTQVAAAAVAQILG